MKIADWLKANTTKLQQADIPTPRLDCLVLLEDVTGHNRAHVLAHPELSLTNSQQAKLNKLVATRSQHQPLAFIRGKTEFFGREFIIDNHVLEPRPESEAMIELVKTLPKPKIVIDVGTGSGALAITAGLETGTGVLATDIDPRCLKVAKQNATKHDQKVTFYQGDLVEPIQAKDLADAVLLANLPYVPDNFRLNQAAMNEPALAIFGGPDGLDLYRQLFGQLKASGCRPSQILTESLPAQHPGLRQIAADYGYHQVSEQDLIQQFS